MNIQFAIVLGIVGLAGGYVYRFFRNETAVSPCEDGCDGCPLYDNQTKKASHGGTVRPCCSVKR